MNVNPNHRFALLSTIAILVIATAGLAACSPSIVAPAPQNEDIYWPYRGIDTSYKISCQQNRELFAYDASAPLDIQESESQRSQGLTVTDLTYASPMGGRVPATLVVPDGKGPFAGMLVQHGMGMKPSLNVRKGLVPEAEAYARMGAVVILIDAPFYRTEHGNITTLTLTERDRREQIQYIVDLQRAVDLLLSRADVDPQRLGYVGHSGGGAIGGLLAGVEQRIKAYALVVGDGGIVTHVTGPDDFGWWDYKPKGLREQWIALMWPIEPINYIGCAAPAALLFQNGTRDESVSPSDALRYQAAGSQPKTVMWYKAGHNDLFQGEPFKDRSEWLRGLIGLASYRDYPANVGYALLAWFLLTAGCLAFLVWELWRRRPAPYGARLMWILATLFLGVVGLAIYWFSVRQPRKGDEIRNPASPARRAMGSVAWAASSNALGGALALAIIFSFLQVFGQSIGLQIAVVFLAPFCISWLIFAVSRWISRGQAEYNVLHRYPIFTMLVSTCLILAGMYPTWLFIMNKWLIKWTFLGINLNYPPLWGALAFSAMVGLLVAYPFHLWMIQRGVILWGAPIPSSEGKPKVAWYLQSAAVVLSLAIMLAALFLIMQLV